MTGGNPARVFSSHPCNEGVQITRSGSFHSSFYRTEMCQKLPCNYNVSDQSERLYASMGFPKCKILFNQRRISADSEWLPLWNGFSARV